MALLKHGDLKEIASDLGVSHDVVRQEASGKKISKRIREAIKKKEEERLQEALGGQNINDSSNA